MASPAEQWLGIVAAALAVEREDPDRAEALFRHGLDRYGSDGRYLAFYATFLALVRRDLDGAERLFRQAMAAPSAADLPAFVCNNYGCFLWQYRRDLDGAEALLRRAAADPREDALTRANHESILATFLGEARGDAAAAAPFFRASAAGAEDHPDLLIHAARFFLATGDTAEGAALLETVLRTPAPPYPEAPPIETIHLLCWFFLFAHGGPAVAETAWKTATRLLGEGTPPFGASLDLEPNIAAALRSGHPRPDRLRALADVVLGRAPAAVLAGL